MQALATLRQESSMDWYDRLHLGGSYYVRRAASQSAYLRGGIG
jgi:hypothetical protein